jgi:hypothetical protein
MQACSILLTFELLALKKVKKLSILSKSYVEEFKWAFFQACQHLRASSSERAGLP